MVGSNTDRFHITLSGPGLVNGKEGFGLWGDPNHTALDGKREVVFDPRAVGAAAVSVSHNESGLCWWASMSAMRQIPRCICFTT